VVPIVTRVLRSEHAGDLASLVTDTSGLGPIRVYVDRSLTIAPYDRSTGSPFGALLDRLDDWIAGEVAFAGFGYEHRGDGRQQVMPLPARAFRQVRTYGFANNDYEALFRSFRPSDTTRVVITDGVQSDPNNQARLAGVAEALNEWLSGGGVFAVLMYRNGYDGQYYSDLDEGSRPVYRCPDRPLLVFVLAPSSQAVGNLLERLGPALAPAHVVRVGEADAEIRPIDESLPERGEKRGRRVMRYIQPVYVPGFAPIHAAMVVDRAGRTSDRYVPIQFESVAPLREHPWQALGEAGSRAVLSDLRPELRAWSYDRRALGSAKAGQKGAPLTPRPLDARPASSPVLTKRGDTLVARFTLPVRRPDAESDDYVLLFSLRPGERAARLLVPDSFSTDDDRVPGACSRTLKLERFLGAILLRNYIPARELVLVDWR
jgi:hypothetical protein